MLFDNGNYNFTIIGDNVLIYPIKIEEESRQTNNIQYETINPINFLENYIKTFFNIKNSYIKIDVIKNPPQIDLLNLKNDFEWQIDEIKNGLKDLANNKIFKIIINDKVYSTELKISIYAGVYIANQSIMKNEFLNISDFTVKNTDITAFKDFDNLIFDISKFKNSQFIKDINAGEALRTNHLKIIPLVKKGENINYIFSRDNIEIITNCILLQDGFENQKVKLKLPNGNERFGIIKKYKGKIYVESL